MGKSIVRLQDKNHPATTSGIQYARLPLIIAVYSPGQHAIITADGRKVRQNGPLRFGQTTESRLRIAADSGRSAFVGCR